jgi:hypothetical protein
VIRSPTGFAQINAEVELGPGISGIAKTGESIRMQLEEIYCGHLIAVVVEPKPQRMYGWEYVIDDFILGKSGSELWPFDGHAREAALKAAKKWIDQVHGK